MKTTTNYVKVSPDSDSIETNLLPVFGADAKWCCWTIEDRGENKKPAKIPTNGQRQIRTSAPADWLTWQRARSLHDSSAGGRWMGIGVLMSSLSGVVGIDIDHCLADGKIIESATDVVEAAVAMGSYIETSPSGTGLRIFVLGKLPNGCRENVGGVEVYSPSSTRYLTVTGRPWSRVGLRVVSENQPAIDDFLARFGFIESQTPKTVLIPEADVGGSGLGDEFWPEKSDDEVMQLLRVNNKRGLITRLMGGKLGDAKGDHSTADYMLCCQIANFTRDEDQIDRLFRQSGLMRPKWNEKRGKDTYGNQTIYRAVDAVEESGENHWSKQAAKTAEKAIERAQVKGIQEQAAETLEGGLNGLLDGKGRLRQNVHVWSQLETSA